MPGATAPLAVYEANPDGSDGVAPLAVYEAASGGDVAPLDVYIAAPGDDVAPLAVYFVDFNSLLLVAPLAVSIVGGGGPDPSTAGQPIGLLLLLTKAS